MPPLSIQPHELALLEQATTASLRETLE